MTDYMYKLSMGLLPHRAECNDFRYVDLGSGTGGTYLLCAACCVVECVSLSLLISISNLISSLQI